MRSECRNASLHGYLDAAYDEWADVSDLEVSGDLSGYELWQFQSMFPDLQFRHDMQYGLQYFRGRMISILDLYEAKKAIKDLVPDSFEQSYYQAHKELPPEKYYLF